MEAHNNAYPRNHDIPDPKKSGKSGKLSLLNNKKAIGIAKVIKGVVRKSKKAVKPPIMKKDSMDKGKLNDLEGIIKKYATDIFIIIKHVKNWRDKGSVGRPTLNCEIKKIIAK